MITDLQELGWVAGLLEGEGWFSKTDKRIQVSSTDEDVIEKLASTTQIGRITGPYQSYQLPHYKDHWRWIVHRKPDGDMLTAQIFPFMSPRRKNAMRYSRPWLREQDAFKFLPESQMGWTVGYLEGEGSFFPSMKMWNNKPYASAVIAVKSTDIEPLELLASFHNGTVVRGERPKRDNHRQTFVWRLHKRSGVQQLIETLIPEMSARRQQQMQRVLDAYQASPPKPSRRHGTRWCYEKGCREPECRAAHAKHHRERRDRKAQREG